MTPEEKADYWRDRHEFSKSQAHKFAERSGAWQGAAERVYDLSLALIPKRKRKLLEAEWRHLSEIIGRRYP